MFSWFSLHGRNEAKTNSGRSNKFLSSVTLILNWRHIGKKQFGQKKTRWQTQTQGNLILTKNSSSSNSSSNSKKVNVSRLSV
jgi:hypothetical protein